MFVKRKAADMEKTVKEIHLVSLECLFFSPQPFHCRRQVRSEIHFRTLRVRQSQFNPENKPNNNKKKHLRMYFILCCHKHLDTKTHRMPTLLLLRLKKDTEVKQCFKDPKACLKLAADDKGYVSFTWTHFPIICPHFHLTEACIKTMTKTLHILHFYSIFRSRHHNGETAFRLVQRAIHQMST